MSYLTVFSTSINRIDKVFHNRKTDVFELNGRNVLPNELIVLYMYVLPKFLSHGIKVGMTICHPGETFYHSIKKRVSEQTHELSLSDDQFVKYGQIREVIYWGVCLDAKNDSFKDYDVHKQIIRENAGLVEKDQEWFINIPSDELIDIFANVRNRGIKREIYVPRPEQQQCIDALTAYFKRNPIGGRFLLNCKMRFGKSYTTYKFCENFGLKKVLILTFVPAVEASWKDDLSHIETQYLYLTDRELRKPSFRLNNVDEPFVIFLSLQNFLGKDRNTSDTKEKIKKLADEHFDLVVLDEYHFGAWNQRTQEKLEDLDDEYQRALGKTGDVIDKFGIKTDKVICLSGTPFKAIARGEFTSDNTFTYSYFDEQKNKYPTGDLKHPTAQYLQFPDMKIFGYNMSALFGRLTSQVFSEDKILSKRYFSLNKFFETKRDLNPNEPISFVYEEEVSKWLEIIKGRSTFGNKFPYSQQKMLTNSKHTLWLLPSINSCIAMARLLENDEYFRKYQIINLSEPGVGAGLDAYDYLLENITKAENTNKLGSISLTVNKLTLGITVKEWFSVFVLKDLASPEQYFQSIFRIQTPLVIDGVVKKKYGYVYDFNIDRAAALILRYAEDTSDRSVTKIDIAKLIVKYLPIFMNGDMETAIGYDVFYQLAQFGDQSGVSLSKKITNLEVTTRALDEETMAAMLNDPEVSNVLKKVFAHSKFGKSKDRSRPAKPEEDGFESKAAKAGRDCGYALGMQDSKTFVDLDDNEVQATFESNIEKYVVENTPGGYDETSKIWYANGFRKGYESGVNVPIKRLNCGHDDGIAFVSKIKEKFGTGIVYTKETRPEIENFMRPYLNDISNIPEKFRGMLYLRWYRDSFSRAVKNALKPVIKSEDGTTVGDTENILKHILGRLVEFLYISVYRETTFDEIFKNADPAVFLEAVGITKKDFETLNKYHVFEENTLNNYIHEFFVNESIGSSLDEDSMGDQYRNSFGWFGFHDVKSDVMEYVRALNNGKAIGEGQTEEKETDSDDERSDSSGEAELKTEIDPDFELVRKCLSSHSEGLRTWQIARATGLSKKQVNRILYSHQETFAHSIIRMTWKIK